MALAKARGSTPAARAARVRASLTPVLDLGHQGVVARLHHQAVAVPAQVDDVAAHQGQQGAHALIGRRVAAHVGAQLAGHRRRAGLPPARRA